MPEKSEQFGNEPDILENGSSTTDYHEGRRPFRVAADVHIQQVVDERQGEQFEHNIFGSPLILELDLAKKYDRQLEENPHLAGSLEMYKGFLLRRLHARIDEKHRAVVAARICEEAAGIGYELAAGLPVVDRATQFLQGIDLNEFASFIRLHYEREAQRSARFLEKNKDFKQRFLSMLNEARRRGVLPSDFDLEKSASRLAEVELKGKDVLDVWAQGDYSRHSHEIQALNPDGISTELLPDFMTDEAIENTVMHEAVHAIGGSAVVDTLNDDLKSAEYIPRVVRIIKNGLSFTYGENKLQALSEEFDINSQFTVRLNWLNEAVTEDLTMQMTGQDEPTAYEKEIELYHLLRQRGSVELAEHLFLGAYFEDFDTEAPVGQRLPKWKKLRRAINEAYDPRFIIELDDMILAYQDEGVKKALELMRALENGDYAKNKSLQEVRAEKAHSFGLGDNSSWWAISKAEKQNPTNTA